ncbi:MAG: riboflavin biosynthesis protein RibF [Chlamydiia bacterium]|nr:riboflavin biosynthesis protein RibF [Chlamydiia bacterium]
MKVLSKLDPLPHTSIGLTFGNFDGVHLGHLAILKTLKQVTNHTVVITFLNHPKEILQGEPPLRICTHAHKIDLLKKNGVNTLISLPFTKELSHLSAKEFLSKIKLNIPFTQLILGDDARFGYQRDGTQETIQEIGKELDFSFLFLKPQTYDNFPISSSRIRKCIQEGDLILIKKLLGRPYSVRGSVISGAGRGRQMGYPTANLKTDGLVLPPMGVYAVSIEGKVGIANLGLAPTFGEGGNPLLEVHIINQNLSIEGEIEVTFERFLRKETKFESIEALRVQIEKDINHLVCTRA